MSKARELVQECKRFSESCLYTSTSLLIWLRARRRLKTFFVVTPLVLGSTASWKLLTEADLESVKVLVSVLAFLAGLFPSIFAALKLDDHIDACARAAAEFKNLQDRFRQVALVGSGKPFPEFETEFKKLMERLELARASALTPPERYFQAARKMIKAGDYEFDVDINEDEPAST